MHRILIWPTYIGRHEFNKRGKTKALKPVDQVIVVAVPPLIDGDTFDAVQAHLKSRNPKVAPPQVVGGPTMLTGICFCADCGGAMTIRTGKSGRYRYYTCSIAARQGDTGCKGRSIRMERLDDLVAQHLEERLLDPARLEEVLSVVLDCRQERAERRPPTPRNSARKPPRPRPGSNGSMAPLRAPWPISRTHRSRSASPNCER